MSTAIATAMAAATPMVVRNGMPATARPSSAMITVIAANTTAEPDGRGGAGGGLLGVDAVLHLVLWREMMNSA